MKLEDIISSTMHTLSNTLRYSLFLILPILCGCDSNKSQPQSNSQQLPVSSASLPKQSQLVLPKYYGLYAIVNNNPLEMKEDTPLDLPKDTEFIFFDKSIHFGRTININQIIYDGWSQIEQKIYEVSLQSQPIEGQQDMIRVIPRQHLTAGFYRTNAGRTFWVDRQSLEKTLSVTSTGIGSTENTVELRFTTLGGRQPLAHEITLGGESLDKIASKYVLVGYPDTGWQNEMRIPFYAIGKNELVVDDTGKGIGTVSIKFRLKQFNKLPATNLCISITDALSNKAIEERKLTTDVLEQKDFLLFSKPATIQQCQVYYPDLEGLFGILGRRSWIEIDRKPHIPYDLNGEWVAEYILCNQWDLTKTIRQSFTVILNQKEGVLSGTFVEKTQQGTLQGKIEGMLKGQHITFTKQYDNESARPTYSGHVNCTWTGVANTNLPTPPAYIPTDVVGEFGINPGTIAGVWSMKR